MKRSRKASFCVRPNCVKQSVKEALIMSVKQVCGTAFAALAFVFFLGALGGYEAGNYGFLSLARLLAVPGMLAFLAFLCK